MADRNGQAKQKTRGKPEKRDKEESEGMETRGGYRKSVDHVKGSKGASNKRTGVRDVETRRDGEGGGRSAKKMIRLERYRRARKKEAG